MYTSGLCYEKMINKMKDWYVDSAVDEGSMNDMESQVILFGVGHISVHLLITRYAMG